MKARQLIEVEDPKTIFRQAQKRKPVTIDDIATNEQPGADPEYVWQALWKNPFIIANRRHIRGCPIGTGRSKWAAMRDLMDRTNKESGTQFYFQFASGYTAPAQAPRQEGWLQGKESWLQGKVDMVRNLFNRDEIGLVKNTEKGWKPSYQRRPSKSGKTRFTQPKTRYDDEAKTWNVESEAERLVKALLEGDDMPPEMWARLSGQLGASKYTRTILNKEFVPVIRRAAPAVKVQPGAEAGAFELEAPIAPWGPGMTVYHGHLVALVLGVNIDDTQFNSDEGVPDDATLAKQNWAANDARATFDTIRQRVEPYRRDPIGSEANDPSFSMARKVAPPVREDITLLADWEYEPGLGSEDEDKSTLVLVLRQTGLHVDKSTPESVAQDARHLMQLAQRAKKIFRLTLGKHV